MKETWSNPYPGKKQIPQVGYKINADKHATQLVGGKLNELRGKLAAKFFKHNHFTAEDVIHLDTQMEIEVRQKLKTAGLKSKREEAEKYLQQLQNSSLILQVKNQGTDRETFTLNGLIKKQKEEEDATEEWEEISITHASNKDGKRVGTRDGKPLTRGEVETIFKEYENIAKKRTQRLQAVLFNDKDENREKEKHKQTYNPGVEHGNHMADDDRMNEYLKGVEKRYTERWKKTDHTHDIVFPEINDSKKFEEIRLDALWNNRQAYEAGAYKAEKKFSEKKWASLIKETLGENPTRAIALLEDKGHYVGMTMAEKVGDTIWKLETNYIKLEHRDNGKMFPENLLLSIEERLKALGATQINLIVNKDMQGTVTFYERNGFERTGEIKKEVKMEDEKTHDELELTKYLVRAD